MTKASRKTEETRRSDSQLLACLIWAGVTPNRTKKVSSGVLGQAFLLFNLGVWWHCNVFEMKLAPKRSIVFVG